MGPRGGPNTVEKRKLLTLAGNVTVAVPNGHFPHSRYNTNIEKRQKISAKHLARNSF
jgi:hypothetical protein